MKEVEGEGEKERERESTAKPMNSMNVGGKAGQMWQLQSKEGRGRKERREEKCRDDRGEKVKRQ